jgi:predicted RNA-binding Zn ribbon-like protein
LIGEILRFVTGPDFVGNALCLDFANTVNKRPNPDRDWLDSVGELTRWAQLAGLRTTKGVDLSAAAVTAEARTLREAVYRLFSAVAADRPPADADITAVMAAYAEGLTAARLRPDGTQFSLHWPAPLTAGQIRWPVAASATQLLLHGPIDRIGECPSCRWLFLDTSRNGRRRWCSMTVCGSREKAQRHYANRTRADHP